MNKSYASERPRRVEVLKAPPRSRLTGGADEPATPVWPGRFHAMMSQVKAGDRGVVDLW